jgi:fibronectin type III domain protein
MKSVALRLAMIGMCGLVCSVVCILVLTGCGTPGAPQPPSLKLPTQVTDLTAIRAGNSVTLHWVSPRKTTDRLLIKGSIQAQVCRRQGAGSCEVAGTVTATPGKESEFHEAIPADLTNGAPRLLTYFVELRNSKGKSAGLSNPAEILAGTAPGAITNLSVEVRADGVAFHWEGSDATPVRLHRRLLSTSLGANSKTGKSGSSLTNAPPEATERDLLVETQHAVAMNAALDTTARFGDTYEYTAQRVERLSTSEPGKTLELAGAPSAPIRVEMIDRFPPAIPQGLVAVAVAEEKSIDLSWQPDTDADLAGYIVYRAASDSTPVWTRISSAQPVPTSAFRDTTAEPGHVYRYRVTAIDQTGHESRPSAETQESMPNP